MDRLVNHLARARAEAGLTQAALADRIGVSRKTINTVENGVFIPSTLLALKLARAFGTPVESLFELEGRDGGTFKPDAPQAVGIAS
ncbi:MAG: helix-turn-helix transcriptional regulator [Allosphingosinicella sp.]